MSWPSQRVDAIYECIVKREAVQAIDNQRHQIIAACYSNPNWDSEKANRQEYIQKVNDQCNEAIELIYYPEHERGEEIDWDNPFWQAHKRGIEKTRQKYGIQGKSMGEVIESTATPMDKEQLRARQDSLKAIDQI